MYTNPILKGVYSKKKIFAPKGSKLFSVLEYTLFQEKYKTGFDRITSPESVFIHFNANRLKTIHLSCQALISGKKIKKNNLKCRLIIFQGNDYTFRGDNYMHFRIVFAPFRKGNCYKRKVFFLIE